MGAPPVAAPDPLRQVHTLFHFTDRRNLALIRDLGGLHPLATLREMGVAIPASGGNQLSHDLDAANGMDRYVHLCFRANHPMEYAARLDGRIVDSVFLEVHPDVLRWEGVRYTPDIANTTGVAVYTIEQATAILDLEVLYTRTNWSDPAIQQRLQQAERCEILVPQTIPLALIRNVPDG